MGGKALRPTKNQSEKESELVLALLNYLSRCGHEKDVSALQEFNVPLKFAVRLARLTVEDFHSCAMHFSRAVPGRIVVDTEAIERTLDFVKVERERDEMVRQLVAADAPRGMLAKLGFAVTRSEYQELRAELGIAGSTGRPLEPDNGTALLVWQSLADSLDGRPIPNATPRGYLHVHQETGLSLRVIWKVVEMCYCVEEQ